MSTRNDLHYAVVIGIDVYPNFSDLPLARVDAKRFMAWLNASDGGGVPKKNIFTAFPKRQSVSAKGPAVALPTLIEVNDAIARALGAATTALGREPHVWESTRLYIFAAGHGIRPRRGRGAVLMANATKDLLGYNIDFRKYASWFRENGTFRDVLIFADCCRVPSVLAVAYDPPFSIPRTGRGGRSFVAYAASPGEVATAQGAGGLFTRSLVRALDVGYGEPEKTVTTVTVRNALCDAMQSTGDDGRQRQRPDFECKGANEIVIRSARAASPAPVVLRFSSGYRGLGLILDSSLKTRERVPVTGAEITVELPPGLYEFTDAAPSRVTFKENGLFRIGSHGGPHYVDL